MSPLDLIRSRDGSMSLTKLAATTGHLLMAAGFGFITFTKGFISELWMVYGVAAFGHHFADKTVATVKDFKDKKLESEAKE